MIDPLDRYVTIKEASRTLFGDEAGPDAFRSWARARGLAIMRVGRKDFVTIRQCLDAQDRPVSTSTSSAEPTLSATAPSASEQALALKAKLRLVSQNTSRGASSPRQARHHS